MTNSSLYNEFCDFLPVTIILPLYSEELVTFEDSQSDYDQSDAKGFIKLNALRLIKNKKIL